MTIKNKLPKGYEIINNAPYAILGKGEVIITDTYWTDENGNITHSGIYFHSAGNVPKEIGVPDYSKQGEIVNEDTIVFGIKSPTVESLEVLRKAVERAISRLKGER